MREGLFVISRGIGQVMFQNNAFSGILMLSGILYSSWQLALLAIIGNIISTVTAWICSYSREDIKNVLLKSYENGCVTVNVYGKIGRASCRERV